MLKEELKSAIDNSFNVLRTRIDRFGVVSPNIQRLETAGRILVELPGVKEPERVRKLLQGSANLEFWETYNLPEIYQQLVAADNMLATILKSDDTAAVGSDTTAIEATEEVVADNAAAETTNDADSLLLRSVKTSLKHRRPRAWKNSQSNIRCSPFCRSTSITDSWLPDRCRYCR